MPPSTRGRPSQNEVDTLPEQTYLNLLRRFGVLLLIAAVLGAASAFYLTRYITPTYESSTTLLVTQQVPVGGAPLPGVAPQLQPADLGESAAVAAVLQQLVKTQPVLERAELTGATGLTAGQIARQTDVELLGVFLRITGSWETPEGARNVATTVTDAFISTVNEGIITGPVSVAVVEAAGIPSEPVSPNRTMNAAAGGMLGLVAAAVLALIYVRMDDVVKSAEQVREATGLPTFGLLPALGKTSGPEQLHAAQVAESPFTEAVRSVRANLSVVMGARQDGAFDRRVVLVTSVRDGDGGNVSAANLAVAFGRAGFRTLLVDCNFRRPTMQDTFELVGDAGLSTTLARRTDPEAAVQSTHYQDVFVLQAGYTKPSSVDALGSAEMRELMDHYRREYDVVLMAAPPALEVPDAATLGPMSDLVLLVGWAGRTRARDLQLSIESLERSGGMPVGVVLNGAGKEPPHSHRGELSRERSSARLPVEVAAQKNTLD